jgi:hypothetical protein
MHHWQNRQQIRSSCNSQDEDLTKVLDDGSGSQVALHASGTGMDR